MKNDLYIEPNWPAPTRVKAYTTLRQSQAGEINISTDERNNRLRNIIPLPHDPIWIKQVHGTTVLNSPLQDTTYEADAVFSALPDQICAVRTADCLPILLCDLSGTQVAAIHAGWRGLASGIIEETLKKFNLPPAEIIAWLGPAIGPTCFEVRQDVYDAFINHDSAATKGFSQFADNHWLANLYTLAELRLQNSGISKIYGKEYCTFSDEERFYSYRRDKKIVGNIISLIWFTE